MTSNQDLRFLAGFVADLHEIRLVIYCTISPRPCQLPLQVSNEKKQLPVNSVSIEIHSGIALFPCDSKAFFISLSLTVFIYGIKT